MQRLFVRLVCLLVVSIALAVPAMAWNVVNTSAPQVNYVFTTSGSYSPTDMVSSVLGNGKLQSRVYQAAPGSPAQYKWIYQYRLDFTNLAGITYIPYATYLSVVTGPAIPQYDYNFDWWATEHVFVIASGGMGTNGLASSTLWSTTTFFEFSPVISAGAYPGGGTSSYFFGFGSNYAPKVGTATVYHDTGSVNVSAYVPNY